MSPSESVVDLAGRWELREAIGETWRWYAAARPPEALNNVGDAVGAAAPGWLPAVVPGSVVQALETAGAIPDPRRGWGSRYAEWTASRRWVVRRTVVLDESWVGADVVLELDGVDPGGLVLWNGAEVGRVDGLYRRFRAGVGVERAGAQLVTIVIDPVPAGVPQVGRTEDVARHAPRMGYGWDFCPPFPHQGVWRPVRLRRGPRISRLEMSAGLVGRAGPEDAVLGRRGEVVIRFEAESAAGLTAAAALDLGGRVVAASVPVGDGVNEVRLAADDVPLWWPLGIGEPRLAEVTLRVGEHEERRRVGFRRVERMSTPGSPAGADAYGVRVNGVPVPLTGVNWAPADAQYGAVDRERLAHLLDLAVAAGARLLRVWGGGLVETEEFYELCDERGLLVWQEFSQSSSGLQSAPNEDPAFVAALAADAEELVPARRHHPSLVIWGGGNELEGASGPLCTEQSPALAALAEIVARRDPDRVWLPTSPSGPVFHNRLDAIRAAPDDQHDVHGPWEYQGLEAQHTLANEGTALAHTEFGVEGMANRRLFERLVPEELREPADRSNPIYRHLGEWWDNAPQVQELFGGGLGIDELRRASQWLQASGLAVTLEADRRRWPRTSMVLPWQLAESYPNAWCTALVGHDGEPKPALAVLSRAFADERVTFRTARTAWGGHDEVRAEVWLWSRTGRAAGGRLETSVLGLDGAVLAGETVELRAVGDPAHVAVVSAPTPVGPFLWRARWLGRDGAVIDDEVLLQTGDADLAGLRTLPRTRLEARATDCGWLVRNTGGFAAVAWGPHDARPGTDARLLAAFGDPRPLLPGAEGFVRLVSRQASDGDLVVDAWNADAVALPSVGRRP